MQEVNIIKTRIRYLNFDQHVTLGGMEYNVLLWILFSLFIAKKQFLLNIYAHV